jgi:hypothetical protein
MNMKNLLFVALALLCFKNTMAQDIETIELNDAIKSGKVKVEGIYNNRSVHYIGPVVLSIINLTAKAIKLKIKPGDMMIPDDSVCQNMMVVSAETFTLKPQIKHTVVPYAMCTEPSDGAGYVNLNYKYKPNKNPKLISMAQYIAQQKLHDMIAQEAVWCVADKNKSLLDIQGYDTSNRLTLMQMVSKISGKPMPKPEEIRAGYIIYSKPQITETVGGEFEYKFSKVAKVHIAMFNARGTVVRELYFNAAENPGVHKIPFEFDYTVYPDAYYEIKLIADDEVLMSARIDKEDEGWQEQR